MRRLSKKFVRARNIFNLNNIDGLNAHHTHRCGRGVRCARHFSYMAAGGGRHAMGGTTFSFASTATPSSMLTLVPAPAHRHRRCRRPCCRHVRGQHISANFVNVCRCLDPDSLHRPSHLWPLPSPWRTPLPSRLPRNTVCGNVASTRVHNCVAFVRCRVQRHRRGHHSSARPDFARDVGVAIISSCPESVSSSIARVSVALSSSGKRLAQQ